MRIVSNTLLASIAVFGLGGDVFLRPVLSHHLDSRPSVGDRATHGHVPLNLALNLDVGDQRDNASTFTDFLMGFGEDPTDADYGWSRDWPRLAQSDPCAALGAKCAAVSNDGGNGQDAELGKDSGYDYDVIGDVLNNPPNNNFFSDTGLNGPFGNGFAFSGPFGFNPPGFNPPIIGGHGPSGPPGFNPPGFNPPGNGPTGPFGGNPPGFDPPGFNPPSNGPTGPFAGNPPNNNPPVIDLADNNPPPGNDPPNNDPPNNDPPNNDPPGDNPPNNGPSPLGLTPLNTPLLLDVNLPDPPANPVPAPTGLALFGIGLASTAFLRRRKGLSPRK